ncbi:MAG: PIN domain-containing protein [Telluria sp.]
MVIDKPVIIDTNIWIDVLGGVPDAMNVLDSYIDIAMSATTYAEVASGCDPAELAMFEAFMAAGQAAQTVQVIHTNDQIIKLASAFNKNPVTGRGHGKKRLPDSIIAATAFVTGRSLLTRNAPDFKMVTHHTPYQGQWIETQDASGKNVKRWTSTPATQ